MALSNINATLLLNKLNHIQTTSGLKQSNLLVVIYRLNIQRNFERCELQNLYVTVKYAY